MDNNYYFQFFEKQYETAEVSNGDFLNGRTIDEAIKQVTGHISYELAKAIDKPPTFNARDFVESKIVDYTNHRGEKRLYFIIEFSNENFLVASAWESELSKALIGLKFYHLTPDNIPVFSY